MILCEFTPIGESMIRMAMDDIPLEYQWYDYIQSFSSFKLATEYEYGGYVKSAFTDLKVSPEAFKYSWPPPKTAAVTFIETDSTRSEGTVIYEGTATRSTFDRHSIAYTTTSISNSYELLPTVVPWTFSGTLVEALTIVCDSSHMNLATDFSLARDPSPDLSFTIDTRLPPLEFMSVACAECTHAFKIVDGTLYLSDILAVLHTVELTEFDVFPCEYSLATETTIPEEDDLLYVYDTATAVSNITTVLDSATVTISCPIDSTKPVVLDTVNLYDESTINPVTSSSKIIDAVYNFDTHKLQLTGFGTIS